jgi:integrase
LKWSDIDYEETRIHIQRNAVKITGEDIIAKDTKTAAWDRYVYFSPETEGLLKEYRRECVWHADAYENHTVFFHPSRPTHGPAGTGPPAR